MPTPSPITVVLADPDDVTRTGMRAVLAADGRFAVIGETAGNVRPLAERLRPDLIVVDPDAAGRGDLHQIADLAAAVPDGRIRIRTNAFEARSLLEAIGAGAQALLLKANANAAFLYDALALIGRFGAAVTGPLVLQQLRAHLAGRLIVVAPEPGERRLSAREREVLALLMEELILPTPARPAGWPSPPLDRDEST